MKQCFKCKKEKPLSEFYKHSQMADGHLNKCKSCARSDVRKNRANNVEYYREYDRDRHNRKAKSYCSLPDDHPAKCKQSPREAWRIRNKLKRYAHEQLGYAVAAGRLTKPKNCENCGSSGTIHGHHEDYYEPLNVMWLCAACHSQRHRDNGEGLNP